MSSEDPKAVLDLKSVIDLYGVRKTVRPLPTQSVARYLQEKGLITFVLADTLGPIFGKAYVPWQLLSIIYVPMLVGVVGIVAVVVLIQILWQIFRQVTVSSFAGLAADVRAALPAMPPLLAVLILLFVTSDAWRVFATLAGARLSIVLGILLGGSLGFLWIGCREFRASLLGGTPNLEVTRRLASRTPAILLIDAGIDPYFGRLTLAQRLNVLTLLIGNLTTRIVGLAFWTGLAFLVLGIALLDQARLHDFLGHDPHTIASIMLVGLNFGLSWELVALCAVFGSLACLYFTALGLQDLKAPTAFTRDVFARLEEALAAYDYYRAAIAQQKAAARPGGW